MFGSLFKKTPEVSTQQDQKNDIINFRNFVLVGGLLILGSIIAFKRIKWAVVYNIHIEE